MANIHNFVFLFDFKECMFSKISQNEFEIMWHDMVERYGLNGNEWIEATYNIRYLWAEAYLRGYFWGELRSK